MKIIHIYYGGPDRRIKDAAAGEGTQRDIIKRCMQGRWYSVLN